MANSQPQYSFRVPIKQVSTANDIPRWEESMAYYDITGFIQTVNEACSSKKLTDACHRSEVTDKVVQMLKEFSKWIDMIPPVQQPQRFGNRAYRDWHKQLVERSESLVREIFPESLGLRETQAAAELATYLQDSFGNATRIDYGTGHELAFVAFLCCLFKVRALGEQDYVAVVNYIFTEYLEVCRKLQRTYNMEPAGSQGAWSLDDFQFVPFIWGSAQLIDHPRLRPSMIAQRDTAEAYSKDYMLMGCIRFICEMKKGPFAEHSNVLWSLSSIQSWQRVNVGMIKMYRGEVLSKHPIIQHFFFGSVLTLDAVPSEWRFDRKAQEARDEFHYRPSAQMGGITEQPDEPDDAAD